MSFLRSHIAPDWQPLSRSAAGHAPAPPIEAAPGAADGERATNKWLSESGFNGTGAGDSKGKRHGKGMWIQVAYALIDVCCVAFDGLLAFLLCYPSSTLSHALRLAYREIVTRRPPPEYAGFLLLYAGLILLFCHGQNLYRTPRARSVSEETLAIIKAVTFTTVLLTAFIYLTGVSIVSRTIVLVSFPLNVAALATWRYAKRLLVIQRTRQGIGARNALIIGAGKVGQALARQLDENKLLGYRFKGFLDSAYCEDRRLLGKIEDLPRVVRAEFIEDIFITIPSERELVKQIAIEGQKHGLDVKVVPELYDGLAWNAPLLHIGDFPVMDICWRPMPALGLAAKRAFDICVSTIALVFCFPVLAVLGAWIKLDSRGPVFYRSRRVGRKGHIFTCYKLRTMVPNADELKGALRDRNERQGPFFKINDDPRITPLGKFLRKHSLDELPQFWNVLRGEMSLVGPRPHPLDDYAQYDLAHLRRLDVRPGITGLWQVTARQDPSFETNMHLDIEYIEKWSFWLDAKILWKTIPVALKGLGQ